MGPRRGDGEAAAFLARARAAAGLCGVTRLADITGLDRLGLPVWQAVRPAGRSLSVHQGKGSSPQAAQIGALCEAIEAHCSEQASADGPTCRLSELPASQRAADMGDYGRSRERPPDAEQAIPWCRATDCLSGRPAWLPHDLVSIDFTRGVPSRFERASSGLGAGPSEADALAVSLLELIERDAVGEWRRLGRAERVTTAIRTDSIPFGWFQSWRRRLDELDIDLRIFLPASVIGIPVFVCEIGGAEAFGPDYRRFYGTAAHDEPEIALFKAFAEAIQSRLTLIAGVRDDIMPSYYARSHARPDAPADAAAGRPWENRTPSVRGPEALAERLAGAGFRQIAVKPLGAGLGVAVTKAFVPGLGSLGRTRRAQA